MANSWSGEFRYVQNLGLRLLHSVVFVLNCHAELGRAGKRWIHDTPYPTVSSTQEMTSRECYLTGDGDSESFPGAEQEEPRCGLVSSTASSAGCYSGYAPIEPEQIACLRFSDS